MNRLFFPVLLSVFLSGCVSQPQKAAKQEVVNTKTPVCETRRQCESMWIDAQDAISMASGMKVRSVSENRIETFYPSTYGRMGGVVTKYPVDEGVYEMRVRFECYKHTDCSDMIPSATNLFNLHLSGYRPK